MMPRELRNQPRVRIFFALTAVILASCLAAASASNSRACPVADSPSNAVSPSNFDYLVLASIADSSRLLAMASYHSIAGQRTELLGAPEPPAAED
jgi:hypothetical protein